MGGMVSDLLLLVAIVCTCICGYPCLIVICKFMDECKCDCCEGGSNED